MIMTNSFFMVRTLIYAWQRLWYDWELAGGEAAKGLDNHSGARYIEVAGPE